MPLCGVGDIVHALLLQGFAFVRAQQVPELLGHLEVPGDGEGDKLPELQVRVELQGAGVEQGRRGLFGSLKLVRLSDVRLFDSREKMTLIVLIVIQCWVLLHDVWQQREEEGRKQQVMDRLQVAYLLTVVIIVGAGLYNVFEMTFKRMEIEIESRV